MKIHSYPQSDALYVELSDAASVDSHLLAAGVVLDIGTDGQLVGIDLDCVSRLVRMTQSSEDNALYLRLDAADIVDSMEIQRGVVFDYDLANRVVGIEIFSTPKVISFL